MSAFEAKTPTGRSGRPRFAAVVNEYWSGSHADLVLGRLHEGYELLWTPSEPLCELASLHVLDPGPADLGAQRIGQWGVRAAGSLGDALSATGAGIDVDGVVLIAERNPRSGRPEEFDRRGRPQDRRYEMFMQVAAECERSGRPVPVFMDKHLGNTWAEISEVYQTSCRLSIPLMAGSSVPVTVRCPPVEIPVGSRVNEVVAVATGSGEPPIFHPLELIQSMIERRAGFETGVASVQFVSGERFWDAFTEGGLWSRELADAAIEAVPHYAGGAREYYTRYPSNTRHDLGASPRGCEEAVVVNYNDGTRVSVLLLTGFMLRRAIAVRSAETADPLVTWTPTGSKLTDVPMVGAPVAAPGQKKPPTWNFDHLAHFVDRFLFTCQSPFPIERTVLTSGILEAAMTSRRLGGSVVETPHLGIDYRPAMTAGQLTRRVDRA
ncbi:MULTISPECIES: hypothetical protein [Arthrobacter]|uniref:Uncharacterized protein n=1 Tax=Arthrobacter terricola TaxID=2547396 RepID=A0A4R5KE75_9MICC|nr:MULTISPECIES: hypothetical protein [Arthrobacter]MBT8159710.1 hypothetical protein [Arthrobacter sp. GN70]TDF93659.1 hypothetical protein E1809_15620 [Arthrobacter terricola]